MFPKHTNSTETAFEALPEASFALSASAVADCPLAILWCVKNAAQVPSSRTNFSIGRVR